MSPWLWFAIPVAVGLCQPIIWQMNVAVAQRTGVMESAVLLHVIGAIAGVAWIAAGLRGSGGGGLMAIPPWALLAGVLGVMGMAAMNRAIPETGVATALAVVVASQLVASLCFEHYGWMGATLKAASPERWLGVGLLAAGAWLVGR